MIVVADTSPINYLVLIGEIEVLPALYRKIIVPEAVFEELQADETPELVRAWAVNAPAWFTVLPATILLAGNLPELDEGEKQAIALFEEINADALIIDERAGREEAARRGIFVIGTLGVLNSAAEKRLIDLSAALLKLKQTSFRASEKLIADLLLLDAKRKNPEIS
jgi:predicted nucleic acid-binding protein